MAKERLRVVVWTASTVAWLGSLSCASAPLQGPDAGGRAWHEARSKHFVVQTDTDAESAQALLAEYERVLSFFENVAFRANRQPEGLTKIVAFKREEDYEALAPRLTAAYFDRGGGAPYDPTPTIVMSGGDAPTKSAVALFHHELTHRFVAFHFPAAPTWLNEGLAGYYESIQVEGDKAVLGLPPVDSFNLGVVRRQTTSAGWSTNTATGVKNLRDLLPAAQIRAQSAREFYADDVKKRDEASTAKQLNYIAAWAQTHVLMLGSDDLQARFGNYLNALGRGSGNAWQENFDAAAEQALETEYRALTSSATTRTTELPLPPARDAAPRTRTLEAWEVHWLWATLRNWEEEPQRRWASFHVDQVIRLAPNRPEGYLLRAALFEREKRAAEQRRELELALARSPEDPDALGGMAWLLLGEQGPRPRAERDYSQLDPMMKKLRRRARNASQWLAVSSYDIMQGRVDQAIRCAKIAARSNSSCWGCYWTLGQLELRQKQTQQGARSLRVAVGLAGEDAPHALRAQLAQALASEECQQTPGGC